MIRAIAAASVIATVLGFSPVGRVQYQTSLQMAFDNEVGALPPTGFWDPLGLSTDGNKEIFDRRRASEVKHGRVAMLAVVGYFAQAAFRLPGAIDLDGTTFDSIPNGVAAIAAVPSLGWAQIIGSIGYWELVGFQQVEGDVPGNFDFGTNFFGSKLDGEKKREYLTKELQNGRLAMLAIMALLTHDVAKPAGEGLFVLHHF